MIPGAICVINGRRDLGMDAHAKPFINQECTIIKTCKSGLIQVRLNSDTRRVISLPKCNITITGIL